MTLPCFAGDPFHSSSDFDLDLADDGGKNVVVYSWYFLPRDLTVGSGCRES